jgi:hypothetical protein
VYDFTFNGEVMEVKFFYTKDIEQHEQRMEAMLQFRNEMERDLPE